VFGSLLTVVSAEVDTVGPAAMDIIYCTYQVRPGQVTRPHAPQRDRTYYGHITMSLCDMDRVPLWSGSSTHYGHFTKCLCLNHVLHLPGDAGVGHASERDCSRTRNLPLVVILISSICVCPGLGARGRR